MQNQKPAGAGITRKYKLLAATTLAMAFGLAIAWICRLIAPDTKSAAISWLISIIGALIGWIGAVILTPYSEDEKSQFSIYSKAVGVFASGYLVAKIDKVFDYLLDPSHLFASEMGFRILVFIASALLFLITVFTHRQYIERDEFERTRKERVIERTTEKSTLTVEQTPDGSDQSSEPS